MPTNDDQNSKTADPKATALSHLGMAIGTKNIKAIKKEEVDTAFMSQFVASVYM